MQPASNGKPLQAAVTPVAKTILECSVLMQAPTHLSLSSFGGAAGPAAANQWPRLDLKHVCVSTLQHRAYLPWLVRSIRFMHAVGGQSMEAGAFFVPARPTPVHLRMSSDWLHASWGAC